MDEIIALLPAYNEDSNIKELVERWQKYSIAIKNNYNLKLRITIIDDGSIDNTENICDILIKEYDNFTVIRHVKNEGLGMAVKTGIKYIIRNCCNCKYICIMDCDNTHDPKYVLDMLKKENESNAGVVIASRYQKGSKVLGVPGYRLLTCKCAKYIYSSFLHVKNVRDYTCGYRLYNIQVLKTLYKRFGSNMISEKGFACMAEILYKLYLCGTDFAEIPFELRYDMKRGSSKMNVLKTSAESLKLISRFKKLDRNINRRHDAENEKK